MTANQYIPDVVSPPGETLAEKLAEIGMSQVELADRTGRPKKTINEIIKGKAPITPDTALQLERVLGIPAHFWNNRERLYRQYLTQLKERKRLAGYVDWVREFSTKAMVKLGWIADRDDPVDRVAELLNFFGIVSPEQWGIVWSDFAAEFRKAKAYESDPGDLSAWLRMGELKAKDVECAPFDRGRFKKALATIRGLTTYPVDVSLPDTQRLCAEAGVAVVLVPELPRSRVSGATRWLSPDKVLLQLSLRYKTTDHLWFTFFHEAGHIFLHGKRDIFLEDDQTNEQEQEADTFAANVLIPPKHYSAFLSSMSGYISKGEILAFAGEMGIAPGILVGRLQHEKHLHHSHCNELKQKIRWAE